MNEPRRVLHIIARMNVGGPAVEIVELMRGLDPNKMSQRLVTGWCGEGEEDFLETQALDITATRIDGLGRNVRPMADATALARLTTTIKESRPHVVHTHTAKAGVLGRLAAKAAGTGARVIHTHHGHLLQGYFGPTKTLVYIQIERQLSRITDHIITVGEKVKLDLLAAGIGMPEQYSVIRSGVSLGPIPEKRQAREDLGLPHNKVIVSMIGRVTHIKRPDRFAEVVKIIKEQGLNAHFMVAGGGDLEDYLRNRVLTESLPVSMLGWRSDMERLLAATDVMILTSDNEGIPLSLIQAGLTGIPVVATSVGSVSEVVSDGQTGLLAEKSAMSLARGLSNLIENPEMRARFGTTAQLQVTNTFSVNNFLDAHSQIYEDEC